MSRTDDTTQIEQQAERLESLLPRVMRALRSTETQPPLEALPLALLRVCGILRKGPHTMAAVGDDLGVTRSAASQLAARLERRGLVERVGAGADRRRRVLRLTPHGESVMSVRHAMRVQRAAMCLERLRPAERRAVLSALETMASADQCPRERNEW
jgi:DNA-binding MarR family transcriptional regulator